MKPAILLVLVLLPALSGPLMLLLPKKVMKTAVLLVQVVVLSGATYAFLCVKNAGPLTYDIGSWPVNMGITLYSDIFGAVFVLMISALFLLCMIYHIPEMSRDSRFYFLVLVLEALTIGIFLSRDLFNIFVLIEIATIVISLLIMYKKDSVATYDGLLYLIVNTVAMSFFVMGVGMLYKSLGTLDLKGLEQALRQLQNGKSVIVPYGFIMTAICLKSAVMPLFSWLPRAHATPSAPASVSAILSGVYVKSGIYLFMRLQKAFSPVFQTDSFFLVLGILTAVLGFLLAIAQTDIKLILAYHTISQIGMIMMGLSMNNESAWFGAVYHIINHALFKSALFLTAGIISEAYGTRDVRAIRGVFRNMPLVSIAALIAILGITGAPFFNGSISKYWIAYGAKDSWAQYALVLVNLGTIVSFVKYAQIMFGRLKIPSRSVPPEKTLTAAFISVLCLLGGLFGRSVIEFMFTTQMPIGFADYMQKAAVYALSVIAGVAVYRYVIKKIDLYRLAVKLDLSFTGICTAMGVFVLFMLAYLGAYV